MIVEKELWQQLSSVALKSVNLAGLTGHGASLVRPSAPNDATPGSQGTEGIISRAGFADWIQKGNPFSEKGLQGSSSKLAERSSVKVNGVDNPVVAGNGAVNAEEDEDDENEDLLADFIDEDSQLPGRLYHKFRKSTSTRDMKDSQAAGDDQTLVLTNSSVSILRCGSYPELVGLLEFFEVDHFVASLVERSLCNCILLVFGCEVLPTAVLILTIGRYMDKYARLMQIMQPIALDVFKVSLVCLCLITFGILQQYYIWVNTLFSL